MTNRGLLRAPRDRLSPLGRQRQHVLRVESCSVPCPACRTPVDAITASDLDVDRYTFGYKPPSYRCPHCAAVMDRVTQLIAFGPGWHWALNHQWLSDRLRRAALYDREHGEER